MITYYLVNNWSLPRTLKHLYLAPLVSTTLSLHPPPKLPSPQSALHLHLEPWKHTAGLGFYSIWATPLPPHSHRLLQEQFSECAYQLRLSLSN